MRTVKITVLVNVEDVDPTVIEDTVMEILECGIDNYVPDDSIKDEVLDNLMSQGCKVLR